MFDMTGKVVEFKKKLKLCCVQGKITKKQLFMPAQPANQPNMRKKDEQSGDEADADTSCQGHPLRSVCAP